MVTDRRRVVIERERQKKRVKQGEIEKKRRERVITMNVLECI